MPRNAARSLKEKFQVLSSKVERLETSPTGDGTCLFVCQVYHSSVSTDYYIFFCAPCQDACGAVEVCEICFKPQKAV
jgi:hypothetical protein